MIDQKKKYSFRDFFDFKEVLGYYFRKKRVRKKPDFNLRVMHGINKISLLLFLIAIIVLIIRYIIRL